MISNESKLQTPTVAADVPTLAPAPRRREAMSRSNKSARRALICSVGKRKSRKNHSLRTFGGAQSNLNLALIVLYN